MKEFPKIDVLDKPREQRQEKRKESNNIVTRQRERFLEIMEGNRSEGEYIEVKPEEFVPESMDYALGMQHNIEPGKWWQTYAGQRSKTINYPRSFAYIDNDLVNDPQEYELYKKTMRGGIVHEMGHHIGEIQTFQAFMIESDTRAAIVTDVGIPDSIIQEKEKRLRQELNTNQTTARALKEAMKNNIYGKHASNFLFVSDLHNIVADIALEAYEKQHPYQRFARESKEGLDAINGEMFDPAEREGMAAIDGQRQLLLSTQFKNALIQRKGRLEDDPSWGEGGFDLWSQIGYVDPEVKESLEGVESDYRRIENLKRLFMNFTERERIRYVQREMMPAYKNIRNAFLRLLKKDIEEKVEEQEKNKKKKEEETGDKGGDQSGSSQSDGDQGGDGESQDSPGSPSGASEGDDGSESAPSNGDGKPVNYDDLDPETREKIINDILDRIDDEQVGHDHTNPDDRKNDKDDRNKMRGALSKAINPPKKDGKDKNVGKDEDEDPKDGNDTANSKRNNAIKKASARRTGMEQRHNQAQMQQMEMLGLTQEQLREYQQSLDRLYYPIKTMADKIAQAVRKKLQSYTSRNQQEGYLPPERVIDLLREYKDGNEDPRLFEQRKLEKVVPAIHTLFVFDHSSSMEGNKKAMAETSMVIMEGVAQAVKMSQTEIRNKLGRSEKDLHRVGVITFTDAPKIRLKLEDYDTSNPQKENAQTYFTAQDLEGGGTADASALAGTIGYLDAQKRRPGHVKAITAVIVITDGEGEVGKLQGLFEKTSQLDNTFFVAIGAGDGTDQVVTSWNDLKGCPIEAFQVKDKDMDKMPIIAGDVFRRLLEEGINKL